MSHVGRIVVAMATTRTLSIGVDGERAGRFVFDFKFSQPVVMAVKLIPGRKWHGDTRTWHAPRTSAPQVRLVAERHDFAITPAAAAALDGVDAARAYHVFADEAVRVLMVRTGYVAGLKAAVKEIPGRRYDGEHDPVQWIVPAKEADRLAEIVDEYHLSVHPTAAPTLRRWGADAARLRMMSRSQESDIVIPNVAPGEALMPFQRAGVAYAQTAGWRCWIADEPGVGKGHPVGTPILTPDGWRPIEELHVGDDVVGSDGLPTRVTGVYHRGVLPVYRVRFSDGAEIRCDGDHLWTVKDRNGRNRDGRSVTVETRLLADGGYVERGHVNGRMYRQYVRYDTDGGWAVPLVAPVQHPERTLPIDPYLLGLLLGDGGLRHRVVFSTADAELVAEVEARVPAGVTVKRINTYDYGIRGPGTGRANVMIRLLAKMGLMGKGSHDKFVPDDYLRGSAQQRLDMLRGLLDTDGHVRADKHVEYSTASWRLAAAVVDIVRSLGGLATVGTRPEGSVAAGQFRVTVKMPADMNPFRLSRKAEVWEPQPRGFVRLIRSVEPDGVDDVVCIGVDAPDRLYVAQCHIVTHNTLQAMAACEVFDRWPVVVSPPSVAEINWAREWQRFFPHRRVRNLRGRKAVPLVGPWAERADVYIVGHAVLADWASALLKVRPQAFILDESHEFRTGAAERTKAAKVVAGVASVQDPSPDAPSGVPPDGAVLMLTGTPIMNRTAELVEQLVVMGRVGDFGGVDGFTKRYVKLKDLTKDERKARRIELNEHMRATCLVRRAKADVLTELPAKRRAFVWVKPDATVMREYRDVETNLLEYLAARARAIAAEIGADPADAEVMARMRAKGAEALVRINLLRQLAAKAKMGAVREWSRMFLASGQSLGVYAHHGDVIDALVAALPGARKIQGGMTGPARQAVIDGFQAKTIKVAVLSIMAAGVAITLTAASDALFVEQAWNPGRLVQAEDRHHRLGQRDAVTATYILAEGTIDVDMIDIVLSKSEEATDVVDGEGATAVWEADEVTPADDDTTATEGSAQAQMMDRFTLRALGRTAEPTPAPPFG